MNSNSHQNRGYHIKEAPVLHNVGNEHGEGCFMLLMHDSGPRVRFLFVGNKNTTVLGFTLSCVTGLQKQL